MTHEEAAGGEAERRPFAEWTALIRSLKGAPLSVIAALQVNRGCLTARELQEATGYSDKPVSQALARLEEMGLVVHHGRSRGWSVGTKRPAGRSDKAHGGYAAAQISLAAAVASEPMPELSDHGRVEPSAVTAVSSTAGKHNLSTGAVAKRPCARGGAEPDTAAGKSPVTTGESPNVVGRNPAAAGESPNVMGESPVVMGENPVVMGESPNVMEVVTGGADWGNGRELAVRAAAAERDRRISVFEGLPAGEKAEKVRVRPGEQADQAFRARARMRTRSSFTTYYCFYRNSKSKKQVKTRAWACARPPP